MSSDLAIRLSGIGKAYHVYKRPEDRLKQMLFGRLGAHYEQTYWALEAIDLEVGRGETVALIGRNGAGKTTLLEIVCGTLTPSTGEVEVKGRIAAMIALGAGFNPEFTGRENAILSATVLGLTAAEIAERLPAIIEFAAIGDFIEQPVKLYSSGMYARLAFAVCAHVDADILIVDEILSVGDAIFAQKCMRFINEFRKRGTMLFVSHDMAAVVNLCDRAIWMERGQLRASGTAKEIAALYHAAGRNETDDPSGFKIGGRRRPPAKTSALVSVSAPETAAPAEPIGTAWSHAEIPEATVLAVRLLDPDGQSRPSFSGGDTVTLEVEYRLEAATLPPLVIFEWRDRLGQVLFAGDTFTLSASPERMAAGDVMTARFTFDLPDLPVGDFVVSAMLLRDSAGNRVIEDQKLDALIVHIEHQLHFGLLGAAVSAVDIRVLS
jgi:lipopolysaccharide transport system ATP-binding protein